MKIILLSTIILLGVTVIIQIFIQMSTGNTETQAYKVMKVEKGFEIRYYPEATMATITSSTKNYKELGSAGFRKLAGYIFGGNKANKQISMTSPVHMDINDSLSTMSFVMPLKYNSKNLPQPNNSAVNIKTIPPEFIAAITFSGFASEETIKTQTELLEKLLKEKQYSYYGHFRYLGYNPPYQLFDRRNEIIVSVNMNSK
jgi:hypothetical protein